MSFFLSSGEFFILLSLSSNRTKIASSAEAILVRLDDKLSRIKNSPELRKNDIFDMIGYLTLLAVQKNWTNFDELID